MELPSIKCIAEFGSNSIGELGSRLTVLWYQPHFAMPIDDQVVAKLKTLNWSELAEAIDDF